MSFHITGQVRIDTQNGTIFHNVLPESNYILIQVGWTHENRFRRYSRDILSDDGWDIIREVSASWELSLEEWDEWMSRVGQL